MARDEQETSAAPEPGCEVRGQGRGGRGCCGRRRHVGVGRGALVEPAVLAALLREGAHGYDLKREIEEQTDERVVVDSGGLYRVLRRLEEDGFVLSRWVESESGPQKREYEPTEESRSLAQDWIEHLRERQALAGLLADALEAALAAQQDGSSA